MTFRLLLFSLLGAPAALACIVEATIAPHLPAPPLITARELRVELKPVKKPLSLARAQRGFFGCLCRSSVFPLERAAHAPDPIGLLAAAYRHATSVEVWSLDTPIRAVPVIREPGEEIRFHRTREILGRFTSDDEAMLARFFRLAVEATNLGEDKDYSWLLMFEQPTLDDALVELEFRPDLVFTLNGPREARVEIDLRRGCALIASAGQFGFFNMSGSARETLLEFFYAIELGPANPMIEAPRFQLKAI